MVKISVIIPVYNVEKYLEECIMSICNQTFKDFEIVIIDDGSSDNSISILKKYAKMDDRIRLFVQENKGISATRNKGLLEAQGIYILFVDSDDYILPNTLDVLWENALKTDADIVLGNAWSFYNDDYSNKIASYQRPEWIDSSGVITGDVLYAQLMKTSSFPPLVYLYFSKRSFLMNNQIWMDEEIVHEDELWTIHAMFKAKRVIAINYYYYYYRQRDGSFMYSNNLHRRIESLLIISKKLSIFISECEQIDSIKMRRWIYVRIFWMYLQATYIFEKLSIIDSTYFNFYRSLLLKVFLDLNYEQQCYCLESYNIATLRLMNLEQMINRNNTTEYGKE